MKDSIRVVLCSVPDRETARRLADLLLEKRLAACVTILPGAESHYVWEGKREITEELVLVIKTIGGAYPALEQEIKKSHPYACPEIVGLNSAEALDSYASWVCQFVGK